MQTPSTPTPLTFGKLLTRAITLYPTHRAILLRTAAIFYLPVAALSYLLVDNLTTNLLFSLVFWPVDAIVSLSLIIHCIDSLHGVHLPSGQRSRVACPACPPISALAS